MTHPHAPGLLTPDGTGCHAADELAAAVDGLVARLLDDLRLCDALADVLHRLGRRADHDPGYCRWADAVTDLSGRLAALAGR